MNFLAHALLAGDDDDDRIGGLMGDFVKGLLPAGLPLALASGVALHRAIDSYADRHPAFIEQFLVILRRLDDIKTIVDEVFIGFFNAGE